MVVVKYSTCSSPKRFSSQRRREANRTRSPVQAYRSHLLKVAFWMECWPCSSSEPAPHGGEPASVHRATLTQRS